jgi:acetylornithine deacetylase
VRRYESHLRDELLPRMRQTAPEADILNERICAAPPLRPDPHSAAERLARALTGANASGTVAFATEAGLFQQKGISAVVCGPGSIAQAHQPDEFVARSQMDACDAFLGKMIGWAERQ